MSIWFYSFIALWLLGVPMVGVYLERVAEDVRVETGRKPNLPPLVERSLIIFWPLFVLVMFAVGVLIQLGVGPGEEK